MTSFGALLITYSFLAVTATEEGYDSISLLQHYVWDASPALRGQQDLVFFHVPMNFGNSIALTAAVGSGSTLGYSEVSSLARQGWDAILTKVQPNAPVWGPLNPDLQTTSELGYPMYYTPQRYWPKDLAEQYFGNKTVFGLLRDPYERMVAYFRGGVGGTARGWEFTPDGRTCSQQLNLFVKHSLTPLVENPSQIPSANLHVQADYFEGPYAITLPLDLDSFPQSASALLQEHGYDVNIETNDMIHVKGCDDTWAGDMDSEARALIQTYYARDFALRCTHFGYCDNDQNHCLTHVAGMCPANHFTWDNDQALYMARQ
mmetsp:Transcript_31920/g.67896  ORF Transcript_31920/g.67896 Transcript_31920/m.67896 type:complete len:317 (+) Transcript_31920:51-1001(+)|eukprot:CAMPEP_0180434060 /NCGR_PEP_ID=MMETSP1036_2-20121128/9762_1 /TAXON_ID=632150 /ORGANISM="Azadinium spinosum, Strain 3D9" /LENGTH=316 /DNA_ID=CAMNT_0022439925 /DNA_START=39 /DNA_END=989 /DNA_ORIENTATION=-